MAACGAIRYDFEGGIDGWEAKPADSSIRRVASSDERAFSGARSLQIDFDLAPDTSSHVYVSSPSAIQIGTVIRFNVWVPDGIWVASFVSRGPTFDWYSMDPPETRPNAWNTWTQVVVDGLEPTQQVGVQFGAGGTPANVQGSIYIHAIVIDG